MLLRRLVKYLLHLSVAIGFFSMAALFHDWHLMESHKMGVQPYGLVWGLTAGHHSLDFMLIPLRFFFLWGVWSVVLPTLYMTIIYRGRGVTILFLPLLCAIIAMSLWHRSEMGVGMWGVQGIISYAMMFAVVTTPLFMIGRFISSPLVMSSMLFGWLRGKFKLLLLFFGIGHL